MAGCAAGQNDVKNFVLRCKISICPRPFSQAFYLRGLYNGENIHPQMRKETKNPKILPQ